MSHPPRVALVTNVNLLLGCGFCSATNPALFELKSSSCSRLTTGLCKECAERLLFALSYAERQGMLK